MMDLNSMNSNSGVLIFVLVGIVIVGSIVGPNSSVYAALKDPIGVAVDPSGNVFTGELRKNIIQKFTNTGKFIRQWGTEGSSNGEFSFPRGVATDSSGNVYVTSGSHVLKYTNTGKFIGQWDSSASGTEFNALSGIAVDKSGNVFTIGTVLFGEEDDYSTYVLKFTNTGTFIKQWSTGDGMTGTGIVDVDSSGNVFVTTGYIQKYTNDGKFIRQWGDVDGIAVDKSNGNVFVTARNLTGGDDHIEKYTNAGKFIRRWGSEGTGKGQFDSPGDIAVDSKGYVFVADTGMDRIQKFTNTGKFIQEWGHVRGVSILSPSSVPMGTGALQ
jgi:tripartite motif-containing protein 71